MNKHRNNIKTYVIFSLRCYGIYDSILTLVLNNRKSYVNIHNKGSLIETRS